MPGRTRTSTGLAIMGFAPGRLDHLRSCLAARPRQRADAQLKSWRILGKLRCPWRAGQLAGAIHVLQIRESDDEKVSVYRRPRSRAIA